MFLIKSQLDHVDITLRLPSLWQQTLTQMISQLDNTLQWVIQ